MIAYVPAEAIASVVGGSGLGPIVLSALVGVPAYLNGYAAPPLVAGLMEQGMSAGAAMAFIVAGAVSCIPAMMAVFGPCQPPSLCRLRPLGFRWCVACRCWLWAFCRRLNPSSGEVGPKPHRRDWVMPI